MRPSARRYAARSCPRSYCVCHCLSQHVPAPFQVTAHFGRENRTHDSEHDLLRPAESHLFHLDIPMPVASYPGMWEVRLRLVVAASSGRQRGSFRISTSRRSSRLRAFA